MTAERRQDFMVAALILSVAAHVGLMIYMRPQVMTHVVPASARPHARGPMRMRERAPEPEAVSLDVLKDVDALKEAPEPVAEGPAPGLDDAGLVGAGDSPTLAPELPVATLELPIPVLEVTPEMSERIHVEGASSFATPIAPPDGGSLAAAPRPAAVPSHDEPPRETAHEEAVRAADLLVPEFAAPDPSDALAAGDGQSLAELAAPDLPDAAVRKTDYKPEAEVMPTVDEKVVAEEKAAVRGLLDVRNAQELERFVRTDTASAQEGEWVYFRVRFSPGEELPTVPKDVVVLMDASGSIGKDRLESCRNAARRILRSCTNSGDRFNLVAFRDKFSYCFKTWQECDKESFARADKWLGRLVAHGRTDVFATIRSVLTLPRDPSRPLIAMVVTDGDANAGVSETAQILSKFTALNDGLVSVYMYGVKAEANRELLDVLTHGNRGESFIYGGSRWSAGSQIDALSERFRDPVLSDLRVVFTAGTKAEIYPQRLRNLYRGEVVDFVGRVPALTREVSFSVKGLNGATPYEGFFTIPLGNASFDASLPDAWRTELAIDEKLR